MLAMLKAAQLEDEFAGLANLAAAAHNRLIAIEEREELVDRAGHSGSISL